MMKKEKESEERSKIEMKEAKNTILKLTKERDEAEAELIAVKIKLSSITNELECVEEKLLLNIQLAQSEIEKYKRM